ncbi:MAG: 50S ribosomal protein L29 [Kiritimatiellae bacterium]|nr:50S ribosomal protein L29 [Kiritimatiellia bacterium]MDD4736302.1 50S ribosomal protein L29 [Kiritimatiellia bacterium]
MKATELRNLTKEELVQRSEEMKKEMFNLRLQQTSGQLEKPSRIKELRRDLARVNTVMTQRSKEVR